MRSRAAEWRQVHSLGREPQDTNEKILRKPRSGDRNIAVIPAAHDTDRCLSPPPGASSLFVVLTLGLTPQGKNMPRLRRSNQGVTPEGLHGGSTSGANLFQDETPGGDLYLASCIWVCEWEVHTSRSFHLPRRNTRRATTAINDSAAVMAMKTPVGPRPVR